MPLKPQELESHHERKVPSFALVEYMEQKKRELFQSLSASPSYPFSLWFLQMTIDWAHLSLEQSLTVVYNHLSDTLAIHH